MKILLSVVLTISVLLWGAVWWVTRDRSPSSLGTIETDPPKSALKTEPPSLRSKVSPPSTFQARPEPPTPVLSSTEPALAQGGEPYKPQTEPAAPPLPPPVMPNEQGVIDMSSDPSTAEFAKFLELGRTRRQQEERAARAQPSAPTPQ